VEIEGFDVRVGQKPKPITTNALHDFNRAFLDIFQEFKAGKPVAYSWLHPSSGPLEHFGSLTVTYLRNWLKYYQLVEAEKIVERLEKPDGPWKNRTTWVLKPTVRGFNSYEMGAILEVDCGNRPVQLGIGKPYTTFDRMFGLATAVWQREKIARSRQGEWYRELVLFCEELLDVPRNEAESKLTDWAYGKASDWNRRKRRVVKNSIKKPAVNMATGEILLPKGQKTL